MENVVIGLVSNAMDSTCLRLRPIYLFIYWLRKLFFSSLYGVWTTPPANME